jgi:hypothetical protein
VAHFRADEMGLLVECRSDSDYAGRPLAIHWQEKRETVKAVLFSWRTPNGKRYRVESLSGKIFDCSYSEIDELWAVEEIR